MNITTTGIAVAVAVALIAVIFVFPNLSPFRAVAPQAASTSLSTPSAATSSNPTNPTPATMTTPDGLQITDNVVGTGATAAPGDTVTVSYVGTLPDGTVFDASANHAQTANGFSFPLGAGQVIKGWDEGVAGMKVGGTRTLVIPPALGYGNRAIGSIPANSTLTFQVQLLSVQGK